MPSATQKHSLNVYINKRGRGNIPSPALSVSKLPLGQGHVSQFVEDDGGRYYARRLGPQDAWP